VLLSVVKFMQCLQYGVLWVSVCVVHEEQGSGTLDINNLKANTETVFWKFTPGVLRETWG
jgi:hypothetical protein